MPQTRRKLQRCPSSSAIIGTSHPSPSRSRRAMHLVVAASLALLNPSSRPPQAQAYVTSGLPAHTHRAFLRKLTNDICNTDPGTLTSQEVSNAPMLMSAWATAPEKLQESGRERALAVEGLLKRMIDERTAGNMEAIVTTGDYNTVMKSWAMSGEKSASAERVEQILTNMQDMYAAGDTNVQPNLESFETAIDAWIRATDEPDALARAQQILDMMTNLYLTRQNDLAMPHTSCFYPILKSHAASGKIEAPIVCEHLIMSMQQLQTQQGIHTARPDTLCFNIVMSSWLKSKDITAEKRIRQVFEYMDNCHRKGSTDIKPDSSSYNIVISSIAPAVKKYHDMGGARRADKILARLERGYLAADETLEPDTIVYNQVIDYWAKTQANKGHYLKAREVLDRQISMHNNGAPCRPDVMGYTAVIGACASTYGSKLEKRRSFDLAHATFMEACKNKYTQPNAVTYGLMFKAVARLLPKEAERHRYARTLFGLCCDDGCLGEMGYNRMKEGISKELFLELTKGGKSCDDLPKQWKINAQQRIKKSLRKENNKRPNNNRRNKRKDELKP